MEATIEKGFWEWHISASWHCYGSEYTVATTADYKVSEKEALKMFRQKLREHHPPAPRIVKFRSI
jgi:hypothetical protein